MIKTALIFGIALAIQAQDVSPEAARKADAAKKAVAENMGFATGWQTFEFVGGQLINGNPVKGQPYSAEAVTESTQTLADGNHIVNRSSSMIYRDSEGRERREESIGKLGGWTAQGAPAKAVFISDPVTKTSYSLDASTHTARKMPAPMIVTSGGRGANVAVQTFSVGRGQRVEADHVEASAGPGMFYYQTRIDSDSSSNSKSPAKTEKLGTQMIEGVQAEGTRTTITIPAGQIGNEKDLNMVNERWYSPELQVTVMSKHSDPRTGETVYKLTNINRSEPLRSMFEIPPDYTVSESGEMRVRKSISKEENQF